MESTLQQLQAEAQRGNAQAQYALGGAYYNGNGVTRNPAQGAQWLLRAAEGGYAPAQCDLGGHVPEWGGSKSELQRRRVPALCSKSEPHERPDIVAGCSGKFNALKETQILVPKPLRAE